MSTYVHPQVEAETGSGGTLETGTGTIHILPQTRPSIALTSVFNPGRPSPIHQETGPGQEAPGPYDLLLWDRDGGPLSGVTVVRRSANLFQLVEGTRVVGHILVSAPPRATDHEVFATEPSFEIATPVTGVPTARLNVRFRAGSLGGDYTLTFALAGGNDFETVVRAPLARLQGEIAISPLIRRLPNLRLAGEPVWRGSLPLRKLEHLPVAWDVP